MELDYDNPSAALEKMQRTLCDASNVQLTTTYEIGCLVDGFASSIFFNVNTMLFCSRGLPVPYIEEFKARNALIPDIAGVWQISRCVYDLVGRFCFIFNEPSLMEVRSLSFRKNDLERRVKKWKGLLIEEKHFEALSDELGKVKEKLSQKLASLTVEERLRDRFLKGEWFAPEATEPDARKKIYSESFDDIFFVQSSSMIHGGYFLGRYLSACPSSLQIKGLLKMLLVTACSCVSKFLMAQAVFAARKEFLEQSGIISFLSNWSVWTTRDWKA